MRSPEFEDVSRTDPPASRNHAKTSGSEDEREITAQMPGTSRAKRRLPDRNKQIGTKTEQNIDFRRSKKENPEQNRPT
jgi:hypothetical protein